MSENPFAPASPKPSLKHELRTPLNHIIGYCEMLQEEAQDRDLNAFLPDLDRIHSAGRKLLAVINEVCDPEKLPHYMANPSLLDHDVRTPLNQIIGYAELMQEEARAQGKSTEKLIPDLERIHEAARELLRRVVAHFVSPPAELNLFDAHAAEEGATAVFRKHVPAATAPRIMCTGRILVVDDDEGNRMMLERRLERIGHHVALATNGREALERLRSECFDLVLLDIQMPELNGYEVLDAMKADPALREVPVIVLSASDEISRVARCVEMGAEDHLAKPFDPILLKARINASLEKKQFRERERVAFEALRKSQEILAAQLAEAERYVRSLLPAPIVAGTVLADWRFKPCEQLGGDAFNYHWLDDHHFAFYVLDVCGHGVGAALLSVSVMNVLNNRSMPNVDFHDPGAVLTALNQTFTMEKQNNMYFTIWYGVLDVKNRQLRFSSGGHPPAQLIIEKTEARPLQVPGGIIGFVEATYPSQRIQVPAGSRIYIYTDGVYELARLDGSTAQLQDLTDQLLANHSASTLDGVMSWAADVRAGGSFEDDISVVEISFP